MIEGSCHCGNVKWSYDVPLESVTACNCTVCRRYGALWAYGHLDSGITVTGKTGFYSKAKKVINFHFCENCGCSVYYLVNSKDAQGGGKIGINLRMANDPNQIASLPIDHFDGLDKFEDLPRDHRCVKDLWF